MTDPYRLEAGALIGCLDNYDYDGNSPLPVGSDVYECDECGALVLNVERHAAWHKNATRTGGHT